MHVRASQVNPYAELDAMYAAQKAAAKGEAERTRKKLMEFASEMAGEADSEACVVRLGAGESSDEETKRQSQNQGSRRTPSDDGKAEDQENSVSDWA